MGSSHSAATPPAADGTRRLRPCRIRRDESLRPVLVHGTLAEMRFGRIRASVWKHPPPEQGDWFRVNLTRLDQGGKVHGQGAKSFDREDLLLKAKVADEAHEGIDAQ